MKSYGISTWVYPAMTTRQAIERLSGLGIKTVEYAFRNLALSSTDPDLKADYLAGKNAWKLEEGSIPVEEINQAAESCQLTPMQMHAPDFNIAWPDRGRRRHAVEKTGIALDLCRRLGVPSLVIHPGIGDPGVLGSPDAAYDRAREDNMRSVRELAEIAADLGVRITLENRGQDIYGSRPKDLIEMVTSIDPDTLSTCIDVGRARSTARGPSATPTATSTLTPTTCPTSATPSTRPLRISPRSTCSSTARST